MKYQTEILRNTYTLGTLQEVLREKYGMSAVIISHQKNGTKCHITGLPQYDAVIRRSFKDCRETFIFNMITNQGKDEVEERELMEYVDRKWPLVDCDEYSSPNIQFKPQSGGAIDFEYDQSKYIAVIHSSGTSVELYYEELLHTDDGVNQYGNVIHTNDCVAVSMEYCVEQVINRQIYFGDNECWIEVWLYDLDKVFSSCPDGYSTFVCTQINEIFYRIK